MFDRRELSAEVADVRAVYAPNCLVVDVTTDFETLPAAAAEELGLFVDRLEPASYPDDWLPADAPAQLRRYASGDLTIGVAGDGTVAWTRQTEPPVVFVKRRAAGTPEQFLRLLIATAFVEIDAGVPESFLPFFGAAYADLAEAVPFDGAGVYQLAAALFDGWVGLQTREAFAAWDDASDETRHPTVPSLFDAWTDAGERLEPRLAELAGEMARGETSFPAATEYACSAVRHALELPAPFTALDTMAYSDHGASFAVRWADETTDRLDE